MSLQNSYVQLCVHPETQYLLQIIADSTDLLHRCTDIFLEADKIVGAQFYYSNPILYLLATEVDPVASAPLYRNLYLMDISQLGTSQFQESILAVNNVFLDQIGDYSHISDQHPTKLLEFHQEHGLYVVAIHIHGFQYSDAHTETREIPK